MSNSAYKFYAELIYGGVPVDREWAMGTQVWREKIGDLIKIYGYD